jgi:hypothetical protein
VPGQHVNRSLLASDRERHLNRALPAEIGEEPDQRFADRRMCRIKQPIEFLAAPPDPNVQFAAEGSGHTSDVPERGAGHQPAFHPRHGRLRHPTAKRQIRLAPPEPVPQRPN